MCYHLSFYSTIELITDYIPNIVIDIQLPFDFDSTVHVTGFLHQGYPIIYRNRDDEKLHLSAMEWGVIPFYVKEEKSFAVQRRTMLNARSERILDDPKSYWYKIRNRRCLIPVTGIYEHRKVTGWKNKVPYFIKMKGEKLTFIPGLYSVVELPDLETGELIKRWTYTLITRPANDLMKNIHNEGENKWRMPLFLPFELSMKWLDDDLSEVDYRAILNYEAAPEDLEYHTVFTIVGTKPRPDGKRKDEPWEWEKLPELGLCNPD